MMRKLIEVAHVSLGGQISPLDWAFPYLDEEQERYIVEVLAEADALFLGRRTYEGLSAAYPAMPSRPFVDRMNAIPKFVASRTLTDMNWNATVIDGDVASFIAEFKTQPGGNIVKYGNGPLDQELMAHGLVDEFHLLLTPVATGVGQHMFEDVKGAPDLLLKEARRCDNGVLILIYGPREA
jgi:dihydrofolate reductase